MPVARHPPHKTVCARLTHTASTLDVAFIDLWTLASTRSFRYSSRTAALRAEPLMPLSRVSAILEMVDNVSVPSRDGIEGSLDKILASRAFRNSDRMSRFLRFAVNHALRTDKAPLKELLIAENVFDRGDSFDSRTDTIVRVE